LAVPAHHAALRVDVQQGVVQAAVTGLGAALGYADHGVDPGGAGGLAQGLRVRTGDLDGVLKQDGIQLVEGLFLARRHRPHPIGIGGNERFGESHQGGAFFSGLANVRAGLFHGCGAVEENRCSLHHGQLCNALVVWHTLPPFRACWFPFFRRKKGNQQARLFEKMINYINIYPKCII